MRKLFVILTITIAFAASSHAASAKGEKPLSNIYKNTATGKHIEKVVLTPKSADPKSSGAGPAKISIEKSKPR